MASACSSPTSNPVTTPTLTASLAGISFPTTSLGMAAGSMAPPPSEQPDHSSAAADEAGAEGHPAPAAAEPSSSEDGRQPAGSTAPAGARMQTRLPTPLPVGDATPDNWATFDNNHTEAGAQAAALASQERASCAGGEPFPLLDQWHKEDPLDNLTSSQQPTEQQEQQGQAALPAAPPAVPGETGHLPLQVWNRSSTMDAHGDAKAGQKRAAAGRASRAGSVRASGARSSLLPPVLPKYRGSPLRVPAQPARASSMEAAMAEEHCTPAHVLSGEQRACSGTAADQGYEARAPHQQHSRPSAMPRLPPRPPPLLRRAGAPDQAHAAARSSAARGARAAGAHPAASAPHATAGDRAMALGSVPAGGDPGAELLSPFSPGAGPWLEELPIVERALPGRGGEGTVADSQFPHACAGGLKSYFL